MSYNLRWQNGYKLLYCACSTMHKHPQILSRLSSFLSSNLVCLQIYCLMIIKLSPGQNVNRALLSPLTNNP